MSGNNQDRYPRVLLVVFLLTLPFVNPYVRGDGNGYYAYVRSVVIDRDLRFEDEFRRGDPAFRGAIFDEHDRVRPDLLTGGGYVKNQWAVGPSLLWAPFFVLAHAFAGLCSWLGINIPADGYSWPYRWLCAAGTASYAFAGLLLMYHVAQRLTSRGAAFVATIAIWFASSFAIYAYFVPFHVHGVASFSVALLLWYWFRMASGSDVRHWAVWGAIGGLVVEIYQLNALFLLIALAELVREATAGAPGRRWPALRKATAHGLAFSVCAVIALGPHFVIKWRIHGSPWKTGYEDRFFWESPRLFQVALSPEHGLLLWTPVLALAVVGLVLFQRRDRWRGGLLVVTFIVYYYVVASYQNWHGQSSFGNRFFVSFTPAFVIGLATLLRAAHRTPAHLAVSGAPHARWSLRSSGFSPGLLIFLGALILWNAGFMFQWGTNVIPNRGPVDMRIVATNQFTIVPMRLPRLLGRYFAKRDDMIREVEREDLTEFRSYHLRR